MSGQTDQTEPIATATATATTTTTTTSTTNSNTADVGSTRSAASDEANTSADNNDTPVGTTNATATATTATTILTDLDSSAATQTAGGGLAGARTAPTHHHQDQPQPQVGPTSDSKQISQPEGEATSQQDREQQDSSSTPKLSAANIKIEAQPSEEARTEATTTTTTEAASEQAAETIAIKDEHPNEGPAGEQTRASGAEATGGRQDSGAQPAASQQQQQQQDEQDDEEPEDDDDDDDDTHDLHLLDSASAANTTSALVDHHGHETTADQLIRMTETGASNETGAGSLMGAVDEPEYTILTPVSGSTNATSTTPTTATATTTQQQQQATSGGQSHEIPHTPTNTILTDLDSLQHHSQQQQQQHQFQQQYHYQQHDSNNNPSDNTTDGSKQQHQHPTSSSGGGIVKVEQSVEPQVNDVDGQQPTLSELTSVVRPQQHPSLHSMPHIQHHHPTPHLTGGGGGGGELHLIGEPQQQQHTELLTSQPNLVSLDASYNVVGHQASIQQHHPPPTLSALTSVVNPVSQASNSSVCSSSPASVSTGIGGRGVGPGTPASLGSGSIPTSGPTTGGPSGATGGATTAGSVTGSTGGSTTTGGGGGGGGGGGSKRRSWSQVNRNLNKSEIAKVYSQYGFRCYLETPISTCRRREEDRITYINKGEFYGLTLEYVPDPHKPLRSAIVKTVVMLVFREEKSPEEDLKSWQFWHSRQHSAKQRILDADNKNHVNVINQIEEVSLNAIAFYWNPIETRTAKLNVAVQCLSTDFSNQKGVKGLPLNLQVDIYDLFTETSTPVYRGYATLLSYCDKGAQRRSRDEERRAMKRRLADSSASPSGAGTPGTTPTPTGGSQASNSATGNKKFEDLYHKPCDRSEFYSMADLIRPPTLYSPSEDALIDGPKQPMSQSSGVSLTPISATTPIPATAGATVIGGGGIGDPATMTQYNQQAVVGSAQAQPAAVPSTMQQAGQAQQMPPTGAGNTVIQTNATRVAGILPPTATIVAPPPPPHSSYSIVSADYMHPVTATGAVVQPGQSPLGMVAMPMGGPQAGPQGHMAMGQAHHQQQQQQVAMGQHQPVGQHAHQQPQHHYHPMGNTLQATYGLMDPHHQQYALSTGQASMVGMVAGHQGQGQGHGQQQHHQQQQQMIGSQNQANQQHQMDSRSAAGQHQQQQQQNLMAMGQTGMMQQQQQQQQQQTGQQQQQSQQMQQQMHQQYQQAPIVGLTTTSMPMGGQPPYAKRAKLYPDERVLIYAKQADEKDFYPLHLSPPSLSSLVYAIEQKYKIDSSKVANIYKKSKKGIRVQMDDEMIRHYCNEDMVQLEVIQTSDSRLEITLVEL